MLCSRLCPGPLARRGLGPKARTGGPHRLRALRVDVKDAAGFKSLAAQVRASLKAYNGEFVMREKVDSLFGGRASNLSVISFPTVEEARTWLASPDLAKLKAERDRVADVRTYLVEKLD